MLECERACCFTEAILLEAGEERTLLSAVPAVPRTSLGIVSDRISDFGCSVNGVAIHLVVSTNLAKGSYVFERSVRARQIN